MFGIFRLLLASLVVVTHIGGVEVLAGLAVWGFFMLSGFLITGVLNRRYGFGPGGLAGFATSRALRLYPTYWIVALTTYFVVAAFRADVDPALVNTAFQSLTGIREWFSALAIVGHTTFGLGRVDHALSPPIWAVDVELSLYVASCILVSRSRLAAMVVFVVCVLAFPGLWVAAKMLIKAGEPDFGGQLIYSFVPAALLPYGFGALLWFERDKFSRLRPGLAGISIAGVAILVLGLWVSRGSVTGAYVLSLPILAYLIVVLAKTELSTRWKRFDEICGFMSYPMYLTHYICAYAVLVFAAHYGSVGEFAVTGPTGMFSYSASGFTAIALLVLLVSAGMAFLVEMPMEGVRHLAARQVMEKLDAGKTRDDHESGIGNRH